MKFVYLLIIIIVVFNILGIYSYIKFTPNVDTLDNFKLLKKYLTLRNKYIQDIDRYTFDKDIYKKKLSNIPIYFINLPRSKERRRFIIKQMKDYNISNYKIVDAIYGANKQPTGNKNMYKIEMKPKKQILFYNNDQLAKNGEIGCTLSHLNTILQAYNNNLEYVIICEDDVDLYWIKTWDINLQDLILNAPKDWEYISLKVNDNRPTSKYGQYGKYQTTAAQILNRNGMKKILDNCYKNGIFILDSKENKVGKTILNILFPITNFFNLQSQTTVIAADNYIPSLLNSYVYHKTLVPVYNNYKNMNSTIHENQTQSHLEHSITDIQELYTNFNYSK